MNKVNSKFAYSFKDNLAVTDLCSIRLNLIFLKDIKNSYHFYGLVTATGIIFPLKRADPFRAKSAI